MSWREQVRTVGDIVHDTMSLTCIHCSPDGSTQSGRRVRYHYSRGALGAHPADEGYGERYANLTEIVFDSREFEPAQNDLLVFESGAVLQVGPVRPPDVRTPHRKVEVSQLEQAAFGRYPFLTPGEAWAGLEPPA